MAKGSIAKVEIGEQILSLFGGNAFWNGEGKEIRINTKENGESLQVKLALTVAKVAVEEGAADAVPGVVKTPIAKEGGEPFSAAGARIEAVKIEASDSEKEAVANLMSALGL